MADGGEEDDAPKPAAHPLAGVFLRAAHEGKMDVVRQMLADNVPVESMHQTGLRALHFAARNGNVELASELIAHGALVNASTMKGNTPLHVAALMGRTQVLKLLLQKGAEVNTQSQCSGDMFTPLYMAAQIGHQEIVTLLLAHGADPSVPTKNNCTARDVASQQGHQAVAELLEAWEHRQQAGASSSSPPPDPLLPKAPAHWKHGLPPVYNDVIPSPRNSPQRSHPAASALSFKPTTSSMVPAAAAATNGECVQ